MLRPIRVLFGCCSCLLALASVQAATPNVLPNASQAEPTSRLTFEQHVRPILKAHCFQCHGEEEKPEAGLDLRLVRLMKLGGDSGPAIQVGDGDNAIEGKPTDSSAPQGAKVSTGSHTKSLLYQRIAAGEMPPGGKRLPAEQLATIERWLDQGAPSARPEPSDPSAAQFTAEELTHWAFQPISQPAVPVIVATATGKADQSAKKSPADLSTELVRTPIDAFLLQKLAAHKLSFSPEADRRTLVRRAYFDLLGLPPTPEQVDEFLSDTAPDAWERLIDRLLAMPQYGERWGRLWLDGAGYADSDGASERDLPRPNAYKYRDYVIRSFNADRPADEFIREQLAGDEMLSPPYKNLSSTQADRLIATGFLRMGPDGTGDGAVDQNVARNDVVAETIKIVSTSLLGLSVGCAQCHAHRYEPISQADYYRFRAIFEPAYDWKSWRAPSARLVSLQSDADAAQALKLETEAKTVDAEGERWVQHFIQLVLEEELEQVPEDERSALREAFNTAAAKRSPEQQALLKKNPKVMQISSGSLYLYDRAKQDKVRKLLADLKKEQTSAIEAFLAEHLAPLEADVQKAIRAARETPEAKRTPAQKTLLAEHPWAAVVVGTLGKFSPAAAESLVKIELEIADLEARISESPIKTCRAHAAAIRARKPAPDMVMALTEVPGKIPETKLFFRGDFNAPRQVVSPGELSILCRDETSVVPQDDPELSTSGRRLAYARHLTNGRHPLLARVLVNRVWLNHFGRGIVSTPTDFGVAGQRPSHPELLDWLASDFMAQGWHFKRLHKLLMTSSAYRQSSRRTPELDRVDADNQLLGRMSVRRLEAEMVRDAVLAVSGRLNRKMFGPAVPVTPDEVGQIVVGADTRDSAGRPTGKSSSLGADELRRSVYVQVRRSMPLSMLETFDAPRLAPNCEIRACSTVAPQSLLLLNNEFIIAEATALAERLKRNVGDSPAAQVRAAWQTVYAAEPTEAQVQSAVEFLAAESKLVTKPATAPLAVFCQALLSSNQFLYVD